MRCLAVLSFAALLVLLAGCDKRAHCTGWSGSDGHLLASGMLTGCSDQKNREVRCARGATDKPYVCTCIEGGTTGKTFERTEALPSGADTLSKLGTEQCEWAIK